MKQRTTYRADTTGKALVLSLVAIALTSNLTNAEPQAHQVQPGQRVSPTPAPTTRHVKLINGNELEEPKQHQNNKKNEAQAREPASAHCEYRTNKYGKFYVCELKK